MTAPDAAPAPSRRPWALIPLLLALLLLGFAVFGEKGLLRALQYRRQQQALEQKLKELEETNAALRKEIEALRSDHRRIEAIARKELGLVRDDELIYQFPSGGGRGGRSSTSGVTQGAVER